MDEINTTDQVVDVAVADPPEVKIDLNQAPLQELRTLPGVGPALARRIIAYREAHGAFSAPEALQSVPGIGATLYAQLADRVVAALPEPEPEPPLDFTPEPFAAPLAEPSAPRVATEARPPAPAQPPIEVRSSGFWSWLWASLTGALLGMIFTLLVLSGINGSLDINHSQAVIDLQGRADALAAQIDSAQTEAHGLRQRLDALEGLTARMNQVETVMGTLQEETAGLVTQIEGLDSDVATLSADVTAVQEQNTRVQTFFQGLQTLLQEAFGAAAPAPEN